MVHSLRAAVLAAVVALAGTPSAAFSADPPPQSTGISRIGGHFSLTAPDGTEVTDRSFPGKWLLLYFGYTFCPDVCPSELQLISAALDALGPKAERIVPLFITIDPERDTPGQLATYVQSFHPRLIGLTGTASEIAAVAKEYRVYVRKAPDPKSTAGYSMDHSALIYLLGPDGTYRAHFTPGIAVETLEQRLSGLIG